MNAAKLAQMRKNVRTGGKGTPRRKKKVVRRGANGGEKRLQQQLKRLAINPIGDIEEVNMFKQDGTVLHVKNPRVYANITANSYVVSGRGENKQLQELLPGIMNQLGSDNLKQLRQLADSFKDTAQAGDDDDVPDLVENFDE